MIPPHGNIFKNILKNTLQESTCKIIVNQTQEIEIYNLSNGTYCPLSGFCKEADFDSILKNMRLKNGTLWSIPIILDTNNQIKLNIKTAKEESVELINENGLHIATLNDIEIYPFDKNRYCKNIFGTTDDNHPGVKKIREMGDFLIGGQLEVLSGWRVKFSDVDDADILTPQELREMFKEKGFQTIVAFQTRNVPHRGHEYIQKCGLENVDALLVHPVIGEKKTGDFQNRIILESYKILAKKYYNPERVIISCLPWMMRYAGPREAILHAIIRQNFGCSHFIVGRDHAGVGNYYGTYDAQKIFDTLDIKDLGITILRYENAAYCPQVKGVVTDKTSPSPDAERIFISGTKFRAMLAEGIRPPEEFIRPEITNYLLSEKNIFID